MRQLNREALGAALRRGITEGWAAFRREHPDERVYGLGLYTSGLATYVALTIFSEEGLDEVAAEYAERSGRDADEERLDLRWSPCDSPHHLWREDLFEEADGVLDAAPDPYASGTGDDRVSGALQVFVETLRTLDAEGCFGADREGMILSVWMGDQSDEDRLAFARRLNSAEHVDRFEAEMEAALEAFEARRS